MRNEKPYCSTEIHFRVPITMNDDIEVIALETNDNDIEIQIDNTYFKKTDGSNTEVQIELVAHEILGSITGDTYANVIKANTDRNILKSTGVNILENITMYDLTGATELFISGGTATRDIIANIPIQNIVYRLKRNTTYLLIATILEGNNGTSECGISGIIRKLN